jgi:hypothetical protein
VFQVKSNLQRRSPARQPFASRDATSAQFVDEPGIPEVVGAKEY